MGKLDRMNIVTMVMHKTDRRQTGDRHREPDRQTERHTDGQTHTDRLTAYKDGAALKTEVKTKKTYSKNHLTGGRSFKAVPLIF